MFGLPSIGPPIVGNPKPTIQIDCEPKNHILSTHNNIIILIIVYRGKKINHLFYNKINKYPILLLGLSKAWTEPFMD